MDKKIIKSKTGLMNMGGYFKEKTAQILKYKDSPLWRVSYKFDNADDVYHSLYEAEKRYNHLCKSII